MIVFSGIWLGTLWLMTKDEIKNKKAKLKDTPFNSVPDNLTDNIHGKGTYDIEDCNTISHAKALKIRSKK
jgi:dynactin complex subunit